MHNSLVWFYHRQTIRTVRGIVMSRATCDPIYAYPIHLLYFITPTLYLILVICRNAKKKHRILHLLIPNADLMKEKWIKITYRMFLVAFLETDNPENVTKTKNTPLKTQGMIFVQFSYIILTVGMKKCKILCFTERFPWSEHTFQLSRIIRKSPGYGTDLPLSRTGHQITRIMNFPAFLCLSLRFSPFLAQNLNFSYSQDGFWRIFALI